MKKNKKIIIIIVSILLIISILGIVLYLYFSKDKKENNLDLKDLNENKETNEDNKPIEYKYTKEGPGFVCSNKELYTNTINYEKGENKRNFSEKNMASYFCRGNIKSVWSTR